MSLRIAGAGWITPLGRGVENVWEQLLLGQEAVPGVHRVAPREQCGTHNLSDPKVALCRARWSDVHNAVGQSGGERILIGIADGNDDFETLVSTGSDDSNRYFPAIRNQNPSSRRAHLARAGSTANSAPPRSTRIPFSA